MAKINPEKEENYTIWIQSTSLNKVVKQYSYVLCILKRERVNIGEKEIAKITVFSPLLKKVVRGKGRERWGKKHGFSQKGGQNSYLLCILNRRKRGRGKRKGRRGKAKVGKKFNLYSMHWEEKTQRKALYVSKNSPKMDNRRETEEKRAEMEMGDGSGEGRGRSET